MVDEIALRQERLANLAKARTVLAERAQERSDAEKAEYDAKVQRRQAQARRTKRKPGGHPPQPPQPGPRDKDQYHFTAPDSRIMKNSTDKGVDQHYKAQIAVTQASLLIVAHSLSNHPNDQHERVPRLDALSPEVGHVEAAALENGYFRATNIAACRDRAIEPDIATGRESHHQTWLTFFAQQASPPPAEASPKVHMASKLQTESGQAIYRLRKCTVEPVIGSIKEVLGFRPFSLRGLDAVRGEWGLVCLAFDLKRWHSLSSA